MRRTVTLSISLKPELYQKLQKLKEALEAERLEEVHMSAIVQKILTLGLVYREQLSLGSKQKELPLNQTMIKNHKEVKK